MPRSHALGNLEVESIRQSIEDSRRSGVTLSEGEMFGPLEAKYGSQLAGTK